MVSAWDTIKIVRPRRLWGVRNWFAAGAMLLALIFNLLSAVTECFPALAVYWGHAATVYEPEMFRNTIRRAGLTVEDLPVAVWVGLLVEKGENGGMNVYTSGLNAFGVMEIEVIDTRNTFKETLQLLWTLAAYQISEGSVVRDGDTVGDADERIKTHHAESAIGRKEKVLRVDF